MIQETAGQGDNDKITDTNDKLIVCIVYGGYDAQGMTVHRTSKSLR